MTVADPWDATAPQVGLWSVGGFSFDLASITTNNGTTISGTGTIKKAGFEDTTGFWSFTSQGSGNGTFSFSSTTVPAPGIVLLLGIGLVGIGLRHRIHKA